MTFSLDFPRALAISRQRAVLKARPEDFRVEEILLPPEEEQGEHVWLWLEKNGQNTEYVAKQLARKAGVRAMDIGVSGLKDRWAVTRQWFSVYLGSRPEADWFNLGLEGVQVLEVRRQAKKLRRGEHSGNRFQITLRDVCVDDALRGGLESLRVNGFPNYFGVQRFGRQGENLRRGEAYFEGKIKASRSQRSFYLSAARSYLFNLILAQEVEAGSWQAHGASGALYGDPQPGLEPITASEALVFEQYPVLVDGLRKNRMKLDRRPLCVVPKDFEWQETDKSLCLGFQLPAGVFATSLLDELFILDNVSGVK